MNAAQQKHYDDCIAAGTSPALAEMFALGAAPTPKTDAEFFRGRWNQFAATPELGDMYGEVAAAHGCSTTGKIYMSSLAKFPGDPEAWVSGRGDVERVLDKNGWGCEGTITRKLTKVEEPEMIPVADDLVQRDLDAVLETVDPRDRPYVDVDDLKSQIVETRQGPWCRGE